MYSFLFLTIIFIQCVLSFFLDVYDNKEFFVPCDLRPRKSDGSKNKGIVSKIHGQVTWAAGLHFFSFSVLSRDPFSPRNYCPTTAKMLANKSATDCLRQAAKEGRVDVVQSLVERGVVVVDADEQGKTALHFAAENEQFTVLQYLVEQGANNDMVKNDGASPLIIAACSGHLGVVQYLVEIGANKEKTTNEGWTALILASQNGHLEVVEHLLEQNTDVDKNKPDGWSPLHAAAQEGHADVVTCLMNWAAPLNARTTDGRLPTDVVANEAIKQLIRDEDDRRRNNCYKRAVIQSHCCRRSSE